MKTEAERGGMCPQAKDGQSPRSWETEVGQPSLRGPEGTSPAQTSDFSRSRRS